VILCRHCRKRRANKCRNLCWTCYYTPGVRDQYPITSKFGRRSCVPDFLRAAPLPVPTDALPGSPEKVRVLADRYNKGLALHHPLDAGWAAAGARLEGLAGEWSGGEEDEGE